MGGSCVGGDVLQILDCKKIDCGVILGRGMGWGELTWCEIPKDNVSEESSWQRAHQILLQGVAV